jgi:hypothetical protein
MPIKKVTKRQRTPYAYGSVLEALSQGLYPDKKHVIRELVQNAYDGLANLKMRHPDQEQKPVQIKIEDSSILVADHGIGMDEKKMREYRYLGFSEKVIGQDAGFRGIGKFAPVALCERIIVDSSPYGIAKRFRVVIEAGEMIKRIGKERNPPLEKLLREHTSLESAIAVKTDHYTLVELQGIRTDAKSYLDVSALKAYLSRTAPLYLNPAFEHAQTIEKNLLKYVPGHLAINLTVNSERLYKSFVEPCTSPGEIFVWHRTNSDERLAYVWYCAHTGKGIFVQSEGDSPLSDRRHPDAGLVFRVRNISVGDRFLPRRTFWKTSPELSFHFFGEIHVLDRNVLPSSDRTDFEDNPARKELYEQCTIVARDLNLIRRAESAERNFDKAVEAVNTAVAEGEQKLGRNALPVELRDEAKYAVRSTLENLKKRLEHSKNKKKRTAAKVAVKRGEKLLTKLDKPQQSGSGFIDITEVLRFDDRCRALYTAIINVLREEFRYDGKRLEQIIQKIHEALQSSKV